MGRQGFIDASPACNDGCAAGQVAMYVTLSIFKDQIGSVDGLGVGDVGSIVLRDRKHLGQDGLIIIVASLDVYDGHVISGPDIVSRGFVYVRESEGLLEEVKQRALDILEDCAERNVHEWGVIKNKIKDDVAKLILQRTRRSPMILPILMEV